jgi:hypothetical protein
MKRGDFGAKPARAGAADDEHEDNPSFASKVRRLLFGWSS